MRGSSRGCPYRVPAISTSSGEKSGPSWVSLGHGDVSLLFGSHPTAGRVAGIKLGIGVLQAVDIAQRLSDKPACAAV